MKKFNYFLFVLYLFSIAIVSCDKDDVDVDPFVATQADLDAATTKILEVTGDEFQDFPHNGTTDPGDSTFRIIYANRSSLTGDLPKGTIVTKRTYQATPDGMKGDKLFVTFAMIKREAGFDPDNANWEYVMMPNDGSNDYTMHPNGALPDISSAMRGADVGQCRTCHSGAAAGDFLFVNDK